MLGFLKEFNNFFHGNSSGVPGCGEYNVQAPALHTPSP